jgi:hypothetical protein
MDKATVKKIRNEFHHLCGEERGVMLPLRVMGPTTNYSFDETNCCLIWDDDSEILYIVMPNTVHTQTTDERLYPMSILTMDYDSITFISVVADRLSLDNFFKDKVEKGLTNETTRKRYFKDITDLYDPRTYTMGDPSPTTEKRPLRPDDEIVDKNATQFL